LRYKGVAFAVQRFQVTRPKHRGIPTPKDLPRILDDKFIESLAQKAKLSRAANREMFAATIRDAAHRFVTTMAIPREAATRREISGLYSAADRHIYKETARRIGQLSPETRAFIQKRGNRRRTIPRPAAFANPARRDKACEIIVRLLRVGMNRGKPLLHAPRPPRRNAELDLIMWIEVAYYEATGMKPALTANRQRPGPFARMVQDILNEVAPGGADAVGLLNKLQRRRKMMQHRKNVQRQYPKKRRLRKKRQRSPKHKHRSV
jgi:hypothetical protein